MSRVVLELTEEEAQMLIGCLIRTSARGRMLDVAELVENAIVTQLSR